MTVIATHLQWLGIIVFPCLNNWLLKGWSHNKVLYSTTAMFLFRNGWTSTQHWKGHFDSSTADRFHRDVSGCSDNQILPFHGQVYDSNKPLFQGPNKPPEISKKLSSTARTHGSLTTHQITALLLPGMAQNDRYSKQTQSRQASDCPLPCTILTYLVEGPLQSLCRSPFHPTSTITSDASHVGGGAHLGTHTVHSKWSAIGVSSTC